MTRSHLLTIAVEDYFQATAIGKLVPESRWNRFDSRIEHNTLTALDLLDAYGIKATFFTVGWIADAMPDVVREIVHRGHEIASKGYFHKPLQLMAEKEFREDAKRSKEALEKASGREVLGYRVAQGHFSLNDLWTLDILREEGYLYDSSIYPRFRSIAAEPWRRFPHVAHTDAGDIWELPLSTLGINAFLLPAAGGNYFRQAPEPVCRMIFKHWEKAYQYPFNMYFHIWELDPDLPKISAAGWFTRLRMYRNIGRIRDIYENLFQRYTFQGIATHLGLEPSPLRLTAGAASHDHEGSSLRDAGTDKSNSTSPPHAECPASSIPAGKPAKEESQQDRPPVTIVIPCYNEELTLPYLANTLQEVEEHLSPRWDLHYLFVDDGSSDGTWEALQRIFGGRPNFAMVRHLTNRGVAAAVLTGIDNAQTEIICSIDCDCTYDPRQLETMIPLLEADTAMVTASPYHPQGKVLNVPGWRLFLSKGLSRIYRLLLHHKFATYTSCFRVYRRSRVTGIAVEHGNFLGVLELLAVLDLKGEKLVECPAVLEVRMFGVSKMKTLRTILGHLGLLVSLLRQKRS